MVGGQILPQVCFCRMFKIVLQLIMFVKKRKVFDIVLQTSDSISYFRGINHRCTGVHGNSYRYQLLQSERSYVFQNECLGEINWPVLMYKYNIIIYGIASMYNEKSCKKTQFLVVIDEFLEKIIVALLQSTNCTRRLCNI